MRRDVAGSRFTTTTRCARRSGASTRSAAICSIRTARSRTWGWQGGRGRRADAGRSGIFLATAHPAKFAEIVEPIIGRPVEKPAPLAEALARPAHIIRIAPTLDAVKGMLGG